MKTKTLTDYNGNRITYDTQTDKILKKIDKHGFIYNAKGERTGHISGDEFIPGMHYD